MKHYLQQAIFVAFVVGNISWVYGCRLHVYRGGVSRATLATTMLMSIVTIACIAGPFNKFHLLWIMPVLIITSPVNLLLFSIPVVGRLYASIVDMFGFIITIGVRTVR